MRGDLGGGGGRGRGRHRRAGGGGRPAPGRVAGDRAGTGPRVHRDRAGLAVWPNAMRALAALRPAGAVRDVAGVETVGGVRDRAGRGLSRTDNAPVGGGGAGGRGEGRWTRSRGGSGSARSSTSWFTGTWSRSMSCWP